MKSQFGFVLVLLLSVLASCKKNDTINSSLSGTWKVSSLVIDGVDKTSLATKYTITFNDNGMMTMKDSMNTYNCSWSDNGMMSSGMDEYHFDMTGCPDDSVMHDLDADWAMDNHTDNSMMFHQQNSINNILSLERI